MRVAMCERGFHLQPKHQRLALFGYSCELIRQTPSMGWRHRARRNSITLWRFRRPLIRYPKNLSQLLAPSLVASTWHSVCDLHAQPQPSLRPIFVASIDSYLADAKPLCRAICLVVHQIVFCLNRSIHKLLASGRQPQKHRSVVRE